MPEYTVTDPFSLLLLLIRDRLKAEVATLKMITKDVGQLETKESPNILPGTCLISFANFPMSDMGELMQTGTGDVIIKTAYPFFSVLTAETPLDATEDAVKFYGMGQAVYLALHGWTVESNEVQDIFGRLTRTGWLEDTRRPGLGVVVQRFSINLEDRSAKVVKNRTAVQPGMTIYFTEPGVD